MVCLSTTSPNLVTLWDQQEVTKWSGQSVWLEAEMLRSLSTAPGLEALRLSQETVPNF